MKYKLLKDLPTFKAGEMFYIDEYTGCLCAENREDNGMLVAYAASTLRKFPNILTEWFEEIEDEWKPWRAKYGEQYWFITASSRIDFTSEWNADAIDGFRWRVGNYFETKGKAEQALAKIRAYNTVKRDAKGFEPNWKNDREKKWCVYCDGSALLISDCHYTSHNLGEIYFATFGDAQHSLDTHRPKWELLFDLEQEER